MSESPTSSGHPVELASKGQYYKSGSARAVLRHLLGEHEAMLADASAQNFHSILDQVLRDLTSEVPVEGNDFDKLLIGDKYHLMFLLRGVSYGPRPYGFVMTCPSCDHPMQVELDLEKDVTIKHPPAGAVEPFKVELPVSERVAHMRLLRVADEKEMVKFVRDQRRKKTVRGDPSYYYTMVKGLLSLDDQEMDMDEAVAWAAAASTQDTLAIRDAIDAHDVGPELEMEFTCEECHHFWYARMPLDADFFRPGVARRRRA